MVTGLLLAAGAGTPDGHAEGAGAAAGSRTRSTSSLDGGCVRVVVVLGAQADHARRLVPHQAAVVVAEDWEAGMSRTLRAGLLALEVGDAPASHWSISSTSPT